MPSISNPPLHPSILLLNPNSSESMTEGILQAAKKMDLPQVGHSDFHKHKHSIMREPI